MLKKILIGVGVLIAVIVLVLGYLGFVPGLSRLMGSDKPRDLGVTHTEQDLKDAFAKAGVAEADLPSETPDAESVKYEGKVDIKTAFTQEELTAFFNDCRWRYCPVSDVQVRANADGSVEMSGLLRFDHMEGYGRRFQIPQDRIKLAFEKLKLVPEVMPFYAKGTPSAADGNVSLNLSAVEFGRLPVPSKYVQDHRGEVDSAIEGIMLQVPGMSVKSADFSGGKLNFDGSYPAKQSFAR